MPIAQRISTRISWLIFYGLRAEVVSDEKLDRLCLSSLAHTPTFKPPSNFSDSDPIFASIPFCSRGTFHKRSSHHGNNIVSRIIRAIALRFLDNHSRVTRIARFCGVNSSKSRLSLRSTLTSCTTTAQSSLKICASSCFLWLTLPP